MIRYLILLAGLLAASPAAAQMTVTTPPDLSAYAKSSDLASVTSALTSSIPTTCGTVPAGDTTMGSVGSSTPCVQRADASRPSAVQAANVVTATDGTWSVTFARTFASSSPIIVPIPVNTGTNPAVCNVATRSTTSATGRCWQSNGVTVGALGAIVNVFAVANSMSLMVVAREPTQ